MRQVGGTGNEPGAHVWPSDVAETDGGRVAVSDFQTHRVNLFEGDGSFQSSFIYTPQNFSAQSMLYDDVTRSFYLYGNRWQNDEAGQLVGAELVHKYSEGGDFIASYLPFPDAAKPLDLYAYDHPAMDIARGNLFVTLPFDYTVYRLTPEGQLSTFLKESGNAFKLPAARSSPCRSGRARRRLTRKPARSKASKSPRRKAHLSATAHRTRTPTAGA